MASLQQQASARVVAGIRAGRYPCHAPLPPVATLAAECGCSVETIRRALRDLKHEGILRNANRGGMVVMRAPMLGHVGIVLSCDHHLNLILQETIVQACLTAGYEVDVLLGDLALDATHARLLRALDEPVPLTALVVLSPHAHTAEARARLRAALARVPQRVYFDLEGLSDDLPTGVHVKTDAAAAAEAVAQHLGELGHRRVAIFGGATPTEHDSDASACARLFIHRCDLAGMHCTPYYWGDETLPDFLRARQISAYWEINDYTALNTISALHRAGLRVPEDISVIGRHDTPWSRDGALPLTTLSLNPAELAAQLVASLPLPAAAFHDNTLRYVAPTLIARCSSGRYSELD